ncbi:glycoside hydrolase family 43 protein [Aspergillus ruber CBS 135680]|uniref:Arabinanase/levansucrase/invertase n=1 Tax=Aspergillus ruber (strain CBS 135680) TaxID=1388766 RepID=A0A017SN04_ASPRC|nr:Arabinanase/levansucrase/invertase [Aspergillus ruber CBS 135680]EYE98363.1 Arabinanase/levansucrase/invertase [Aspergillus ruber CBS 135680]
MQRDDGRFVLYYSGELKDWKRHHCVGVAVTNNTSPLGPYVPQNTPLVCPLDQGGAIDPSPFKDIDGKLYIVYKVDGNSIGNGGRCNNSKPPFKSVPIMLQELEKNGTTPIGDPVQIFEHDDDEDGELVESPNLIRTAKGIYYLFYSSHCFISPEYDVKYATSPFLRGPYTRAKREFLRTGDFDLDGPGGATVSQDGTKMVFHANCDHERCMYVAGIHINSTALNVTLTSL